jgi:hypothetical protein
MGKLGSCRMRAGPYRSSNPGIQIGPTNMAALSSLMLRALPLLARDVTPRHAQRGTRLAISSSTLPAKPPNMPKSTRLTATKAPTPVPGAKAT